MNEEGQTESYSPPGFSTEESEMPGEESGLVAQEGEEEETHDDRSLRRDRRKKNSSHRYQDPIVRKRVEEATFFAQQAAEQALIIQKQREQLEAYKSQLESSQSQLYKKDEEANQYYETSLDAYSEQLQEGIKKAIEDGDVAKQVELIDKLADVKAKKNTNQLAQYHKYERQVDQLRQIQEEPYVPLETSKSREPAVNEHYEAWVAENPWFEENPRLRKEAEQIGQDFADRLSFKNQSHMIGTPEFFKHINQAMSAKYDMGESEPMSDDRYEEEYEQPREERPYTASPVAPVTRPRSGTMAAQYVQQNSARQPLRALSKEEFALARHLPMKRQGESEMELVKRYASAKNYPKSPLPGGTPYRLTII